MTFALTIWRSANGPTGSPATAGDCTAAPAFGRCEPTRKSVFIRGIARQLGGRKHLVPGGFRDELVDGLADNRGRGATPAQPPDLGIPRVMCVFDPTIRIADGDPP